ncbi:MAG: FAD-binding oxidoreductase [Gemmobacter sp.]|jgi:D-arginine dehydrogenase|nr:FAD-binding oxidoreductase [Gemmobacter sp.]
MSDAEVIVIGGGIAGASAAWRLAPVARVVVLEREDRCGHHSTGRSAASFTENYGTSIIRRLAIGSRDFLTGPPEGFAEHPLLGPRGMITIAREDQADLIAFELDRARRFVPSVTEIPVDEAVTRVPVLRRDYVARAIIEPDSKDIDVNGLHEGFLRGVRRAGGRIVTGAEVLSIARHGADWEVETPMGRFRAPRLVNAAGAWGDVIARLAGVRPQGLMPMRRTAFNIACPQGMDCRTWPLLNDVGGEFYFKVTGGQIMVSPGDATPSSPMDAWPEEMDIAIGADRLERATTLQVRRVLKAWAGLRTFAPDGSPVVGEAPDAAGFFWLVGQGGYGIKTSPALSRIVAAQVLDRPFPGELAALGLSSGDFAPGRAARAANMPLEMT